MRAQQFIKDAGIKKAREVVEGAPEGTTHIHSVTWQNYKQGDSNNYVWGRSDQEGWYLSIYETLNGMMVLEDLKRLVESVDLVKREFGTIEIAKTQAEGEFVSSYWLLVHKAITDYESIYGEGNE